MEEERQILKPEIKTVDYQNIKVIYLLLFVCPENLETKYVDRLRELGARGIIVIRGQGSAKPGIMELLGFDNNDKSIIFASAPDDAAHFILSSMEKEILHERGAGIGLSIKAAGFAGARYLFRNFMQKIIKTEEIKQALSKDCIIELMKTMTVTEVLFSEEMAEILKESGAPLTAKDIKTLVQAGKIFEIVNTREYLELVRAHGIDAEKAQFCELTKDTRLQDIMKSEPILDYIKSGDLLKIFDNEDILELYEEKGAELFEAEELKKVLKNGGLFDIIISKEMQMLIEEKGLTRALKSKLMKSMISEKESVNNDNKEQIMSNNKLIMTIVSRGFAGDVMDAAREKGATGGTILGGRGTGSLDKSLFGIRIEPEKDIVMIVAKNEICKDIVEAINDKAGLKTPGSGICFLLPIDEVVGLTSIDSFELIK